MPLCSLVGRTDSAFEDMLDEPIQLLNAFFGEMTEWETVAHELISRPREDETRMQLLPQLRLIQGKYCAPDAKVRDLESSKPPSFAYMNLGEPVFTSKARLLVTVTRQIPGFDRVEHYEFIIVRKDGRWFISKWLLVKRNGKREEQYI